MSKPYLVIVTGRLGSGKTTFSKALSGEIFMPVISRDQIKEGYVQSFGKGHTELPQETNGLVTNLFFDTLKFLVTNHVSVIAEAAFQHKIWSSRLEWFMERARIYVLVCKVDAQVALDRFLKRGLNDPSREYFHGDKGIDMARKGMAVNVSPYEELHIDVPTFCVSTSGEYSPSVKELANEILK